jgi:glucose-6-phosphate isomerase
MPEQIKLYYKNATSDVVGFEHGISQDELDRLTPQIAQITADMAAERKNGKLPYRDLPYQQEMVAQVKELVNKLKGRFDNLVVLGIGGSALGNIALQTALNSPLYNIQEVRPGPRLFVMDNVDPVQFGALLDYLDGQWDRTLFNVISKSGWTAETAAQFLIIQDLLTRKLAPDNVTGHIVATTDAKSGILRKTVQREGYKSLVVPDGVGGRFSVLSHVGLFSAAMCGIDIDQLLVGARDMDERVQSAVLRTNPAAMFAAIQYSFYQREKKLSVMMPYSHQLKDLCDWYRQLWAESLGKEKDLEGNQVHVGPTPIKALGATDQHSQVQLYREGPNDKVFTFLEVMEFNRDVAISNDRENTELAYLSQKSIGKLLNSEKLGTEYALIQSQRPCLTVRFPEINPYTVGQFIYMFEVATSYMGGLLNINPYDQPAVELGKQATFALMGHETYQDIHCQINQLSILDIDYIV